MTTENRRRVVILSGIVVLLLVPLIAMQFTQEIQWSLLDFIIAGILLLGLGAGIKLCFSKIKKTPIRILLIGCVIFLFFLVWAELAVGIF